MTHAFSLNEYYEVLAVDALVTVSSVPNMAVPVFDLKWYVTGTLQATESTYVSTDGESGPHMDIKILTHYSQWLPPTGRLATNPATHITDTILETS